MDLYYDDQWSKVYPNIPLVSPTHAVLFTFKSFSSIQLFQGLFC